MARIEIIVTVDVDQEDGAELTQSRVNSVAEDIVSLLEDKMRDGFLPADIYAADWQVGVLSTGEHG